MKFPLDDFRFVFLYFTFFCEDFSQGMKKCDKGSSIRKMANATGRTGGKVALKMA
jgi:hypothetical protein